MTNFEYPPNDPNPIELLHRRMNEQKPFAIIYDGRSTVATILAGDVTECDSIDDIPRVESVQGDFREKRYDTLGIVPYQQLEECGLTAVQSDVHIRLMHITGQSNILVNDLIELEYDCSIELEGEVECSKSEKEYEEIVDRIIAQHIRKGDICNITLSLQFTGMLKEISPSVAVTIFQRVLSREYGVYMTYLFFDGKEYHIAASPEMHYVQEGDMAYMTPISGTIHKKFEDLSPERLEEFFRDKKEVDELFMCADEELKKMAQICETGGVIRGPFLREMSNVVHSEYILVGKTSNDCYEMLKKSMHPATVTGSPQDPATKIIANEEGDPRHYYAGAFFLHGHYDRTEFLDSAIHIRGLRILPSGLCEMRVGATIVKDSVGKQEYRESHSKAAGVMQGIAEDVAPPVTQKLESLMDNRLTQIFNERNIRCNEFHFNCQANTSNHVEELIDKTITVISSDDDFAYLLKHMITAMGANASVIHYTEFDVEHDTSDIVLMGPGSGVPNEEGDSENAVKMRKMEEIIQTMLQQKRPLAGVCLGHQKICQALGLEIAQKTDPTQGVQEEISFFKQSEYVGFYNAYVAQASDIDDVDICADETTGEVHAIRGKHFFGTQFHPESLRTQHGFSLLAEELKRIV